MKRVKTGVIHGRFQLLHNDHMKYLLAGKARCEHLVIGIANPDPTLTKNENADENRAGISANPLTYYERHQLIREALLEAGIGLDQFAIVPFPINFPELLKYYVPLNATFFLTIYDAWGEEKLARFTSLGLTTEVLWRRPLAEKGIRATDIRNKITSGTPWQHLVPPAVSKLLADFDIVRRLQLSNLS